MRTTIRLLLPLSLAVALLLPSQSDAQRAIRLNRPAPANAPFAAIGAFGSKADSAANSVSPAPAEDRVKFALGITSAPTAAMLRDSIVALARAQIGTRYVLGGVSPRRGFDCSGLVQYVLSYLDLRLPRTAAEQSRTGERVARDTTQLLPGDLVTFGSGRVSHVGIYVGEGRFVHASSGAGRVIESKLVRPPARRLPPWAGVRRVITGGMVAESDGKPKLESKPTG